VRFWKQIPEPERSRLLAEAVRYFAKFTAPSSLRRDLDARDYSRFKRQAENDLVTKFQLPRAFPARARRGLLASLIVAAVSESKTGQPYTDERMASLHALLLKEG
jgi:hypothetical protein